MIETTRRDSEALGLPDLPPRRQVLLHDPVASYMAGLDESTKGAVQRSLRRVAKLVDAPSPEAVPWEYLRYGHYQAIKGKLLAYRRDPDDPDRPHGREAVIRGKVAVTPGSGPLPCRTLPGHRR